MYKFESEGDAVIEEENDAPEIHPMGREDIVRIPEPVENTDSEAAEAKKSLEEVNESARLAAELEEIHTLKLEGEDLEYAMVRPKENLDDSKWIVFIGGFATTKEQYKREILGLVKLGKPVIFVNPNKGAVPTDEEQKYFSGMKDALPSSIAPKAAAVAALLEHLNIQHADIIGNSQGAAVAAGFAGAHPEVAARLVLDSPAGMIGKDSVVGLLRRVTKDAVIQKGERAEHQHLVHPELRAYDDDVWKKYYEKVKTHLPWRLTKEVPDVSKIDLRPVLSGLKESKQAGGSGPEIVLFNAYSDVVFPEERIAETLGDDPYQYIDRWAMYANQEKKHSKYDQPQLGITPEEYNAPGRDSVLYQLFSEDGKNEEVD